MYCVFCNQVRDHYILRLWQAADLLHDLQKLECHIFLTGLRIKFGKWKSQKKILPLFRYLHLGVSMYS